MLMFAFFAAVFSSVCWLIYSLMFVHIKMAESGWFDLDAENMMMFMATVFLPIWVIWAVFGYVNQFLTNRSMSRKQGELLTQLQKNQDYTDLVVRVMLDAEHEIKDGFVLNKFDIFISDMNEALGEIIQRCNIASNAQLEQLWQRVRRGEKWALGKEVLDASKNQSTFDAWVKEKAGRDKVFRGSLLEFCSRYQNLLQLLEKHDRDRVFLRMVESGVLGKVYSIIAPLSDGINEVARERDLSSAQTKAAIKKTNDYASVLKLATMEEPKAEETIINVDKNDEDAVDDAEEQTQEHRSFWAKINPFSRKREREDFSSENDPFFQALHNSFRDDREPQAPVFGDDNTNNQSYEPEIPTESATSFNQLQSTLNSLRGQESTLTDFATARAQNNESADLPKAVPDDNNVRNTDSQQDDENLIYPFGGWTDAKKYNQ